LKTIERHAYQPEELSARLTPVIDAIRSVYEPDQIILFGTAACGQPWHDLDLLVVARTEDDFFDRVKKVALALKTWIPTDIFVLTPEELEAGKERNRYFLVEEILKKGRVVYEGGRRPKLD
jgi:predicted nucleotidyltransferase